MDCDRLKFAGEHISRDTGNDTTITIEPDRTKSSCQRIQQVVARAELIGNQVAIGVGEMLALLLFSSACE